MNKFKIGEIVNYSGSIEEYQGLTFRVTYVTEKNDEYGKYRYHLIVANWTPTYEDDIIPALVNVRETSLRKTH